MGAKNRCVSAAPLVELVQSRGRIIDTFPSGSWGHRAYYRAVALGTVTIFAAEKIAVSLGYHPADLWGDEWWTVPVEVSARDRRVASEGRS